MECDGLYNRQGTVSTVGSRRREGRPRLYWMVDRLIPESLRWRLRQVR
jgi:hypothetical protein